MDSPFVSATRVAIEELLSKHLQPSKYGAFLSGEAQKDLIEDILGFVQTSRRLKSAGDRMLADSPAPEPRRRPGL